MTDVPDASIIKNVQRMLCQVRITDTKRESGENPERSGHCIRRACLHDPIAEPAGDMREGEGQTSDP